jgi:SAM-dependent methyltransferase
MLDGNYCIRSDYEIRDEPGVDCNTEFWSPTHLQTAELYQYPVYKLARDLADEMSIDAVCDIGCGPAAKLAKFFAEFEVVGIDRRDAIDLAKTRCPGGRFFVEDFDAPGMDYLGELGEMGLIVCADVIEHLQFPDRLFSLIRSVANQDSLVVLSSPEREALHGDRTLAPRNREHVREWNARELREFVECSGFVVVDQLLVHPFRYAANWMTVSHLVQRLITRRTLRTCQIVVCRVL